MKPAFVLVLLVLVSCAPCTEFDWEQSPDYCEQVHGPRYGKKAVKGGGMHPAWIALGVIFFSVIIAFTIISIERCYDANRVGFWGSIGILVFLLIAFVVWFTNI